MHLGVPTMSPQKLKVGKKLNIVKTVKLTTFLGCEAVFFFPMMSLPSVLQQSKQCLPNNVHTQ